MKTLLVPRSWLLLVAALILAGAAPAQAVRFAKTQIFYRTAVFQTTATTKVAVNANPSASLADLRTGDHVTIAFDQENGVLVAHHVADNVPPKPLNPSVQTVVHHHSHHAAVSTFAHVHGIVTGVNAQAGTLAVAYRVRP